MHVLFMKPRVVQGVEYTLFILKKYLKQNIITTKVVSSNRVHGEVYLIQHYVIKFVSDLRQVGGLLRVLRFPPPIKLTAMK